MVKPLITKIKSEALELTLEEIYQLSGLRFHDFLKRISMSTKNYGRLSNIKFKDMSKTTISKFNYLDTIETVNADVLFPLMIAQAKEISKMKEEVKLLKEFNSKLSGEVNALQREMQTSVSSQDVLHNTMLDFKRDVQTIANEATKITKYRITPRQEKILEEISEEDFSKMTVEEIRKLLKLTIEDFLELIDRSRNFYYCYRNTTLNDLSDKNTKFFKDILLQEEFFISKTEQYDILTKPLRQNII